MAGVVTLRPYQREAHRAILRTWEDHPGAMLVMATGTGKTLTALSFAVERFVRDGRRVVWLAHREELLDQPAGNVAKFWPDVSTGIVQADRHTPDAAIVFASVATLATSPARAAEIVEHGAPALVVVDEAHHSTADTHQAAIDAIGAPLRLGLTATPHRADGADLASDWEIAYSYGIAEAIRDGALVPPYAALCRLPDLDLDQIAGRWDYDEAEMGAELLRKGIVAHTVAVLEGRHTFRRLPDGDEVEDSAKGRPGLVFTATVEQAKQTSEALEAAGWRARWVSGETPKKARRRLMNAYRRGLIDVICNAGVITEGTDLPRTEWVLLARATRSWSLYVQILGRGMRLHGDKARCLVLDLAGSTQDLSIVSAPVLIGGSPCPKSGNGEHRFEEDQSGRAVCADCGRTLACYAALGPHQWTEDNECSECGRPRCGESPTKAHSWIGIAGYKRRCVFCGAEVSDPLSSLTGPRKRREDAVEGDWVRLSGVAPECAAVDVGEHGILFVTWEGADFRPWWLVHRGRVPRPLSDGPIRREYVRAYADDLVTRAAKQAADKWGTRWKERPIPSQGSQRRGERYGVVWKGEKAGDYARRVFRARARQRAIDTGLVEEVRT